MRLKRGFVATICFLLLGAGIVAAREIQQGDQCIIEESRTIEGNLFVLCRTLVIDGEVDGNVIGVATTTTINGTVTGDVYMIAGQMEIHGKIGEDVHFAGPVLSVYKESTLTGESSDLTAFSLSTTLEQGSIVPGSVIGLGYQLVSDGTIGRELSFWGSSLTIAGEVGGDVDAQVGDSSADVSQLETLLIPFPVDITLMQPGLSVEEGAHIEGQLSYAGPTEATIADGAVSSEPIYNPVRVQPDFTPSTTGEIDAGRDFALYLTQSLREFLALGFVGVVSLFIAPRAIQAPLRSLQARPLVCLGVGLLSFIMVFVAIAGAVLLSILIVIIISLLQVNELTFAVGSILGVIDLGGTSALLFIAIFISRVIFCLAVGRALARVLFRDAPDGIRKTLLGFAIGAALLAIVVSLPVVGWIVNGLAAFLGLGAILTLIQARAERAREATSAPRYNITIEPPTRKLDEPKLIPPPPPIIDTAARPLGMDNLPEGFTWWDD